MAGKMRSPNYPALSLTQAVQAADKLWKAEKRTPVSHETAAQALGFKSLSGPARVSIGALRQYGFIEKADKGQVRLSGAAIAALHGNPDEKQTALRRAALTPALFKELAEHYGDASDGAIRSYLITKKQFAEDGAKKAAKAFRDTLTLAKPEASGYTQDEKSEEPEDMLGNDAGQNQPDGAGKGRSGEGGVLSLNVPYAKGTLTVQVRVTGDTLKPAHIERVVKYLELAKDDLGGDE